MGVKTMTKITKAVQSHMAESSSGYICPYPPPRSHLLPRRLQVIIVGGIFMLVFEIFALPNLTPRFGVTLCQRVGSAMEVPAYFLIPLLSQVKGTSLLATAASVFLLFTALVGTNTVCMLTAVAAV